MGRAFFLALRHTRLDVPGPHGAARALTAAGARLVYREIEDLSHTYPRDENPRVLGWLEGFTAEAAG